MDAVLRWWFRSKQCAVKAYAFNAGDPGDGFHAPVTFDPEAWAGLGWEDSVQHQTGFAKARVEVRLVNGTKKRRVVLYPGDPCDPTFPDPVTKVIIHACLVPRADATAMDVTRRVQKYMGNPLRDVRHMFPFDDHTDNMQRFESIRVVDIDFGITVIPLV